MGYSRRVRASQRRGEFLELRGVPYLHSTHENLKFGIRLRARAGRAEPGGRGAHGHVTATVHGVYGRPVVMYRIVPFQP